MASPANNNSSSSPPIPSRPNPKPRNSEAADPMRRSFGGNPFPANPRINHPTDLGRRKSFEFSSDKENETKAVPTPKLSKNFMSPTISAASKINASPRRKRVLSDRNEIISQQQGLTLEDANKSHHHHHHQAQSHVSFSDVIHIISDGKDEKSFEESHDMTVTDFDDKIGTTAFSDPRFRISPRPCGTYTSSPDPLLPPYDPKRNYMSPRPQFLHYKPNPRIEERSDECKQLEDLFISSSDTEEESEVSAEESENREEQEKDTYDEGGAEEVIEEETEDAESDVDMVSEIQNSPKQSGYRKLKFLGWLLALFLGCMLVSATFSPSAKLEIREFAKANNLSKLSERVWTMSEYVKGTNLEQLSEKLWTLTESSLVRMDELISRLGRGKEYGLLQFYNLTIAIVEDDSTVFNPSSVVISEELLLEKSRLVDDFEEEGEKSSLVDGYGSMDDFEDDEDCDDAGTEFDEEAEMKPGSEVESTGGDGNLIEEERGTDEAGEKLETGSTMVEQEGSHEQKDSRVADHPERGSEEVFADTSDDLNPKEDDVAGTEFDEEAEMKLGSNVETPPSGGEGSLEALIEEEGEEVFAETSDDLNPDTAGNDLANKAVTIVLSSAVLVLMAVVAFLFAKRTKPSAPETTTKEQVSSSHVMKESSVNFEEEIDDRVSRSSLHNSNKKEEESGKSYSNRKLRRESSASSGGYSLGSSSFSYGSFTTYEKIPIKTGDGEEEMITPVRRSSRLRKTHQTSSSGL